MSRLASRFLSLFSSLRASSWEGPREAPAADRVPTRAPLPVWTRLYPAGRMVVREGDPGDSMFLIVEGRVTVMRQPGRGAERTVGALAPGDFFGELALVTDCHRTASVMAVERTVLLEFSRAGLDVAGSRHGIEEAVVRMACQERLLADAFGTSPLLGALPPELAVQLGSALVPQAVKAGAPILTRGMPGDALYLLLRGRCSVFHTHPDGDVTAFPDLEEGAVFGEVSLLRSRVATATVKALTPCTLLRLDRDVFQKFFAGQPVLRQALVQLGLARVHRTVRLMEGAGRPVDSD
jgi:cAMP-dependent protein kinase regulator